MLSEDLWRYRNSYLNALLNVMLAGVKEGDMTCEIAWGSCWV